MKSFKKSKVLVLLGFLFFVNIMSTKADVGVNAFSIPANYLTSGELRVSDPLVRKPFKFNVSLGRHLIVGTSNFEDASSAVVTLVYSNCGECGIYTPVSTPRKITNADFYQGATNWPNGFAHLTLDAELPTNVKAGFVMIKFDYYDSNQKKMLVRYFINTRIAVSIAY